MKNLKYLSGLILLMILSLSINTSANAQFEVLLDVDVNSCYSDEDCEVVTRQYTGMFGAYYTIHIRCMDSAGNFDEWESWESDGIINASYCNGEM